MSTIYDHMLAAYDLTTAQRHRSAIYEVSQQIILSGLSRGGFFDVAAFYGGTCLRMFHGLQRFSEDMDFTLLAPDDTFDLTRYFQPLIDEFALLGRKVEIRKKEKTALSSIHSAFLKDTTDVYDLTFRTDPSIKIKLEVDVRPPPRLPDRIPLAHATPLVHDPLPHPARPLRLEDARPRLQGLEDARQGARLVRHGVVRPSAHPPRLPSPPRPHTPIERHRHDLRTVPPSPRPTHPHRRHRPQVKRDALPFVSDPAQLDLWSTDYFLQVADQIILAPARERRDKSEE